MQKTFIIVLVGASLTLSACSSVSLPGVHKIDIQQGNVITQDMVDKLEPGMDKSQVKFVLGTPPIVDVFHQQRWDYVYSMQPGGDDRQQRRIALFFENDKLARMEGNITPATGTRLAQAPRDTVVTLPAGDQKKSIFSRLKGVVGLGDKEPEVKPEIATATIAPEDERPENEGIVIPDDTAVATAESPDDVIVAPAALAATAEEQKDIAEIAEIDNRADTVDEVPETQNATLDSLEGSVLEPVDTVETAAADLDTPAAPATEAPAIETTAEAESVATDPGTSTTVAAETVPETLPATPAVADGAPEDTTVATNAAGEAEDSAPAQKPAKKVEKTTTVASPADAAAPSTDTWVTANESLDGIDFDTAGAP